jgi:Ca-activated chloride channel family protein
MWTVILDNKEIIGLAATLLAAFLGILAAFISRRRLVVHKIVALSAQTSEMHQERLPEPENCPEAIPGLNEALHGRRSQPKVEIIPSISAACSDASKIIDVLVRITPPEEIVDGIRPPLNIGLVLDHSGSMAANNKLGFALEATTFAVQQLRPSDQVSLTIFDDQVETIVPSTLAVNKDRIIQLIRQVRPGGSTALYGGWQEAGQQVIRSFMAHGLNRVLLISDGLANVGETNPNVIAGHVKLMAQKGVSCTAMGVGNDFNEDLLQAMARAGDGNYFYIESPRQLPDIFQTELQGLVRTMGHYVSLGIEPQDGVTVLDVLNDLERTSYGRLKLSNLIGGIPIEVVIRLNVARPNRLGELCRFRLAWNDPHCVERRSLTSPLILPWVSSAEWSRLAPNPLVQEHIALLQIARLKKQASEHMDKGNRESARRCLQAARELLTTIPSASVANDEAPAIARIEASLESGDFLRSAKEAKYQHYWRTRSRPQT